MACSISQSAAVGAESTGQNVFGGWAQGGRRGSKAALNYIQKISLQNFHTQNMSTKPVTNISDSLLIRRKPGWRLESAQSAGADCSIRSFRCLKCIVDRQAEFPCAPAVALRTSLPSHQFTHPVSLKWAILGSARHFSKNLSFIGQVRVDAPPAISSK